MAIVTEKAVGFSAIVALMSLAPLACAPTPLAGEPPVAPPAAAPAPAPAAATASPEPLRRSGGVLYHTPAGAPSSLDYCKHANSFGAMAWVPVFEGLVSFDYKAGEDYRGANRIVPFLAERWEQADDSTYLFHLRPGVKFQSGLALNADDAVFSLNYIRDPANGCFQRSWLAAVKTIDKVDNDTVRIITDGPQAVFLESLAQREVAVFPRQLLEEGKLFKSVEDQIGTGPMRVKSFDRESKTVYTANKQYWKNAPYLEGVVALYGTDRSTRFAAFVARQIDQLGVPDTREFETAKAQVPDAQGESYPTSNGYAMYMRVDRAPLNDARVRRALHLALDRQQMERTLAQGAGRINPPVMAAINDFAIPPEELVKLPGYRQPKDQDIAEAKRLLAEAGYPSGFNSAIQAVAQFTNPRIAEVAAAQLEKIGIVLKHEFIDQGVYNANQREGNFEIQLNGMSSDFIDRSLNQYYYSRSGGNPARIVDPRLDDLIERQRTTIRPEDRRKVLREIQDYMLEQMYVIPTIEFGFYWLLQPWVHDLVNARNNSVFLYRGSEAWFDDRAPARSLP